MVVIIVEWYGEKKWGSRNKNGEAGKQKSRIPKKIIKSLGITSQSFTTSLFFNWKRNQLFALRLYSKRKELFYSLNNINS